MPSGDDPFDELANAIGRLRFPRKANRACVPVHIDNELDEKKRLRGTRTSAFSESELLALVSR